MRRASCLVLLVALPAFGIHADEVCRWKAGAAANPITRFFTSSVVECHPATENVPADWNRFAREGDALISAGSDLKLIPAAKINATVPSGASLFAYVPRTSFAIPGNVIPADTDVIPLLIKEGKVVAIANRVNVPAGKSANVVFDPPRANHVDVVVPIVFAPKSDPSIEPPQVLIGEKDKPIVALNKGTDASLLVFRDVAPAKVKLSGKRWKTTEVGLTAGPVVVLDPITATQTSKLIVNWWAAVDPATLRRNDSGECKTSDRAFGFDQAATKETKFVAIAYGCQQFVNRPGTVDPRSCKEVARQDIDPNLKRGTVEFEGVPVGTYLIDLDYPGLPELEKRIELDPQGTATLDFPMHYISFFGRVTRGGKPLHVSIFGTQTDPATGQYVAVVRRLPAEANTQEILPCDGSSPLRIVSDKPPKENEAFDIDVPDNRIVVEVYDKASAAPITKARVSYGARKPDSDDSMHFVGSAGETDAQGTMTIASVLNNRTIHLCATREDYEGSCAPDFTMKDVSEKSIRLDLTKAVRRSGRIDAHGPFTHGWLVWVSPVTGVLTELLRENDFAADGTFAYKKQHSPGEIVMFTAADKPMYVFRYPALEPEQSFDVVLPPAPSKNIAVSLAETAKEAGWLTLQIGDIVLPSNVFGFHLQARHFMWSTLSPGGTLTIPDILATGPITVILIPQSYLMSHPGAQPPYVPDAAVFPRQQVGPANAVAFP
jgi:hypothetical protein